MTDIVERLRSGAAHQTMVTTGLVNQAADTIAALRAEVERLRSMTVVQKTLIRKHEAENERLNGIVDGFTLDPDYIRLTTENEKLRAALKMARPFIGWAGYYPTILAEVDAALGEKP